MARAKDKVVIGYVHPVEVAVGFHHSLLMLMLRDQATSRRVANVLPRNASANITNARNGIVRDFLESDADWLWMVDADMVFEPDTLDRLLDAAHDRSHPIVGGLCYGVHDNRLFPTLYGLSEHDGVPCVVRFDTFPKDQLFAVDATGAACVLVHRSVLERIGAERFNPAYPWFQETVLPGTEAQVVGEDVTFCFRARALGFPVHVHTGIHVGHQKTYVLTHDMYLQQIAAEGLT